jgi:hypothetical protein
MKAKMSVFMAATLAFVSAAAAAEEQSSHQASTSADSSLKWNTDPNYWKQVLRSPKDEASVKIGKGEYKVRGPLIDGIRRSKRTAEDRSLGRRLLSLPIVRWFVPQPMPNPPGGGKYFLWGESDKPWASVAGGGAASTGNPAVTHEAASLISIGK